MKKNFNIAVLVLVLIIIGLFIYQKNNPKVVKDPLVGCYVATLAKDVYTLNIASKENEAVSGTLSFKNFEKDSSSGSFEGMYKEGILSGIYSFQSEGANSIMEVIFKKTDAGFVRGVGEMNKAGDHFIDKKAVTYDDSVVFKPASCKN